MRCRPDRWWLGVPVLLVLWGATCWIVAPDQSREDGAGLGSGQSADSGRRPGGDQAPDGPAGVSGPATGATSPLQAALERLRAPQPALEPAGLLLRREGKLLTLEGHAPPELREQLAAEARRLDPSFEITDRSTAGSPATTPFPRSALLAVAVLAGLPSGEVALSETVLMLRTTPADFGAYNRARDALAAAPPGISVDLSGLVAPSADPFSWAVTRRGGEIVLSGFVPSEHGRKELLAAIRAAMPGLDVVDGMQTASGVPAGIDFLAVSRWAADQVAQLDEGSVELRGRILSVTGGSQDRTRLAAVAKAFETSVPAEVELGGITLSVLPVSPYRFSGRRKGGTLVLDGFAPSEVARQGILDAARRAFLADRIVDNIRVADGAPPRFGEAATFALEQLAQLAAGEANLSGTALRIEGEALYHQQAERTRARIARDAPPGWNAVAAIELSQAVRKLDPELCDELVAERLRAEPLRFEPGKPVLAGSSLQGLSGVADVLRRCAPALVAVSVSAAPEDGPDPRGDLARARAEAVIAPLARAGIDPARLRAAGAAEVTTPISAEAGGGSPTARLTVLR
jgi:OOP family OmpA-OmpF porin